MRLAAPAVAGSAAGLLGGWGLVTLLQDRTGCCLAHAEDPETVRLVGSAAGGVGATALALWVTGHGRKPRFGQAARAAGLGLAGAALGAVVGIQAGRAAVAADGVGAIIGASIGQGALAALIVRYPLTPPLGSSPP